MGKRVNPALIGAFVLGERIGLIVTAVVIFGSGRLFRKSHEFVIYFGGDINGLRVGAPVKFQGASKSGRSRRFVCALEQDLNRQNGTLKADVRIPVIIELDEEKILAHGGTAIDLSDPHTVPNLIREGLRAQLGSDSFVTGLMYVALDIEPNTPIQWSRRRVLRCRKFPRYQIRSSKRRPVAVRIFEKLDKVDFANVFQEMTGTLDSIKQSNRLLAGTQNGRLQRREKPARN